jgi:hypothetical protein
MLGRAGKLSVLYSLNFYSQTSKLDQITKVKKFIGKCWQAIHFRNGLADYKNYRQETSFTLAKPFPQWN